MIGRICGTSTRSCSCHQPAPSMRAASAVSGGKREQRRGEDDDAEAELLPDDEPADRDDRQVRVAEPVLRERAEVRPCGARC